MREPSGPGSMAEMIMDSLGDGVLIVDQKGLIQSYNGRFLTLWGLDSSVDRVGVDSGLLAHAVKNQLLDPEGFIAGIGAFAALDQGAERVDNLEFTDGRVLERRVRFLGQKGLESSRLLIFRDITEQVEAQKTNQALAEQVQSTQRLESLGLLAGGLAHEFNNILMVVLGNVDLMSDYDEDPADVREHLAEIRSASRRAVDLCEQMLTYAGKGGYLLQDLNLVEVVRQMRGILDLALGKETDLELAFSEPLPRVLGDADQMRQVILNLVSNAADACSGQDSVKVALSLFRRQCSQAFLDGCLSGEEAAAGAYVCLEVADNGCGLEPEQLNRVFDPFYTTKLAGRGLGLSAVLGIVRGHGGCVCVKSRPGRGSTFSVLLPIADGDF